MMGQARYKSHRNLCCWFILVTEPAHRHHLPLQSPTLFIVVVVLSSDPPSTITMASSDHDEIARLMDGVATEVGRSGKAREWVDILERNYYDSVDSLREISREEWNGSICLPGTHRSLMCVHMCDGLWSGWWFFCGYNVMFWGCDMCNVWVHCTESVC
jgi:hypothetical protein